MDFYLSISTGPWDECCTEIVDTGKSTQANQLAQVRNMDESIKLAME
jgi:hypothetical protein